MRRLLFVLVLALLPIAPASPVRAEVMPAAGALFGVADDPHGVEAAIGRTLSLHRVYRKLGQRLINDTVRADAQAGRTVLLSIYSRVPWSDITAGHANEYLREQARAVREFGHPILLAFHHEPEDDRRERGTPQEFAAAYRHVVDLFRGQGVRNVEWVWILMAWTFRQDRAAHYYPGDGYVDFVSADGYNWGGCRDGRPDAGRYMSFREIFGAMREFALAHDKPAIIAEWGSTEYRHDPRIKAAWIDDAAETVKSWPVIKALAYFNHGNRDRCHFHVDSSPHALAAFQRMAADPYFHTRPR